MSYPATLDSVPTGSNTYTNLFATLGHFEHHNALTNAVNNIEGYLGVRGSADTTSVTYQLNNIATSQITSGAITTALLAAGAVTTSKIASSAVTSSQIASGAVGASQLAVSNPTVGELSGLDFVNLSGNFQDGWLNPNESWTFASFSTTSGVARNGTFTVPGNLTSRYSVGDKITFVNNGNTVFGYIMGATYSTPNTTISYIVDSSVTVINSAFTSNYYSKGSTPNGFPGSMSWVPTFTAGGSISLSATTLNFARFWINGHTVHYNFSYSATIAGSGTFINFTSPTNRGNADNFASSCYGQDANVVVALIGAWGNTSLSSLGFNYCDNRTYPTGANSFRIQGFYLI